MVSILQQYRLRLVISCNLEIYHFKILIFNFNGKSGCVQHLKYVLDLVVKLPQDGTLVSKHVGVGT